MADAIKEYKKDEKVTVLWEPKKCIHSEKCFKGLPDVFNPNNRPWVNVEGASSEQIVDQVSNCPSGALSIKGKELGNQNNIANIVVSKNGPYVVRGVVEITYPDGRVEEKSKTTALCRCGSSQNKPFCDGTHAKINFEG